MERPTNQPKSFKLDTLRGTLEHDFAHLINNAVAAFSPWWNSLMGDKSTNEEKQEAAQELEKLKAQLLERIDYLLEHLEEMPDKKLGVREFLNIMRDLVDKEDWDMVIKVHAFGNTVLNFTTTERKAPEEMPILTVGTNPADTATMVNVLLKATNAQPPALTDTTTPLKNTPEPESATTLCLTVRSNADHPKMRLFPNKPKHIYIAIPPEAAKALNLTEPALRNIQCTSGSSRDIKEIVIIPDAEITEAYLTEDTVECIGIPKNFKPSSLKAKIENGILKF